MDALWMKVLFGVTASHITSDKRALVTVALVLGVIWLWGEV